jgi:hypothetical protein
MTKAVEITMGGTVIGWSVPNEYGGHCEVFFTRFRPENGNVTARCIHCGDRFNGDKPPVREGKR